MSVPEHPAPVLWVPQRPPWKSVAPEVPEICHMPPPEMMLPDIIMLDNPIVLDKIVIIVDE